MTFADWSPAQLAHALGYRLDLRNALGGQRHAYLIGPSGREHPTGHARAWATLSRLAVWRRIDPTAAPHQPPRALVNGKAQPA